MKHNVLQGADKYRKAHRQKKWWYRVVTCLAAVVVFCTTYALILPAITMEGEVCGLQEHTHSLECYTQVTSVSVREPVCTQESLNLHRHTQDCYGDNGNLICGYADYVIHIHNASCYTEDGTLWCPLPEIGTHVHGENCYCVPDAAEQELHAHTENCYTLERGQLVCGLPEWEGHIHGVDCYTTVTTLVCETPESEGHIHGEDCYNEKGELVCGLEETEGHIHGESCYATETELICELQEDPGHQHMDECYDWSQVLICDLSTEPVEREETAEPVLICEQPEIALHIHSGSCFDESGNVICGKLQTLEHVHTEDCFRTTQQDVDTETLTCTLSEGEGGHVHGDGCYDEEGNLVCGLEESAGHRHIALCYGTWELTCGLPEHIHTDVCLPEEESETVYFCSKEVHAHDESCYDEAGELICTLEEHTHTEDCLYDAEPETVYFCGKVAHIHDESCYIEAGELICTLEEHTHTEDCLSEEETVFYCGKEAHSHDESCYDETGALICTQEAHVHTIACLSDPNADVETAQDWELTFADVQLTGNWPVDVVQIARTQIGYHESTRNYIVTENGELKGYTRYGAWYGNPYEDWCAMFVAFCMHYAQVEHITFDPGCQTWIDAFRSRELYAEAADYIPTPGDVIFFDNNVDGTSDHVGLVEEVTDTAVITIEGNAGNAVVRREYAIGDPVIFGYGILPDGPTQRITKTAVIYTDGTYQELAEDATVITLTGSLPEDAEVRAFPVTVETARQVLCAYDIAILLPDGMVYELPDEEIVSVSIQSPVLDPETLEEDMEMEVYYVSEEGDPQRMESQVTEEGVSFDTDHFSVYMVLAVDSAEVENQEGLKEAILAGTEKIMLIADFEVDFADSLNIPADAEITLILNGHTMRHKGSAALFTIPYGAKLTIVDSQPQEEDVAPGALAETMALAVESDNQITLTYYITNVNITNSSTGATTTTDATYTVTSDGIIIAGNQPTFKVTGGTLDIQSGMIYGGTGRAIVQTGGTTNLSGGYICGFNQSSGNTDNTSFGGAIHVSGGTIELTGSVLAGNTAHNGGAIYATDSAQISITGGVISGNTANRTTSGWNDHSESGAYRCGGGGIYADGNAEITMSGGYITNNEATHDGYFDGGGGVCLSGTSSMALSGGYITGNQAQGGGGLRTDFGKATTFVMTGGFVTANVATHAEGGGIAIDRNGVGTITGGYITNNQIPNTGHWGGGGLFCADGSTLNLKNTLITSNTAGGFGGGVAGCPTGNLYLYVTEGCAIFDNRDSVNSDSPHFTTDGVKQIDREICTEVFQSNGHADYFCALNSTVTGTMLGNNAANWQGSADYQPVIADAEDVLTATRVMGLKANPTESAKNAAEGAARVYINGNYSYTHGGGIMCNGNLVIGIPVDVEVPARVELQATKTLLDGSGNTQPLEENDFSFKVTMTDPDGTVIASGSCDSSGKITFDHQLTFKQEGTFVYYVYEEVNAEDISVAYDPTLYRLTMTVTKDNGVAWYGDTIKYTYSLTSVKVESSADGETWTQVSQSDTAQSGIISLPLISGTTFTNRLIQPTKITVLKKWEGGSGTDSVTVILKKDGEEVDRQTLNAGNEWTYTWDDLESGHNYTVEEVPLDGYTTSYEIKITADDSGSTSLGQGSWWVPATELTAGKQYLIVSPDGSKALYIASGNEGQGFDTADVTSVTQQQSTLTVNGQTYSTWYQSSDIPARSIYNAEALTRNSHSGIILKRSDGGSYPYLRLESNNNNYLKGGSATGYASFMVFDGTYLRGHNASEWTPDNLRTVIYADGKFNSTTEQNPANAVKLYTLVSGEGFTGAFIESETVVITNTRDSNVGGDYVLPETGGPGTIPYTMGGLLLMAAGCFLLYSHKKRGKEDSASS